MNDALTMIRRRFRERCVADLVQVRSRLAQAPTAPDVDFHTRIHQIAGLAGSIGFDRLSEIAIAANETIRKEGHASLEELALLETALEEVVRLT
jgi:HPt (histidine-containing phosphotransfer) domain-containing protein